MVKKAIKKYKYNFQYSKWYYITFKKGNSVHECQGLFIGRKLPDEVIFDLRPRWGTVYIKADKILSAKEVDRLPGGITNRKNVIKMRKVTI